MYINTMSACNWMDSPPYFSFDKPSDGMISLFTKIIASELRTCVAWARIAVFQMGRTLLRTHTI